MNDFWNQRYSQPEYAYGAEPNEFFREQLMELAPGKLLLPAEGEGRNAVFAALQGWMVTAFDPSAEGKRKASLLAAKFGVTFDYLIAGFESVQLQENYFDVVSLIYAHHPQWQSVYASITRFLKPGGTLIIEVFGREQLKYSSGGPKEPQMLTTAEELKTVLSLMSNLTTWDETIELTEGRYHQGTAAVVRCVAVK